MDKTKQSDDLGRMFADLARCPTLYRPSNYWIRQNENHKQRLLNSGLENIKRSVNLKYFNWGILAIIIHGLYPFVYSLLKGNISPFTSSRFNDYDTDLGPSVKRFNKLLAYFYKTYVCCLFDYTASFDKYGILKKIGEPKIGNPFVVSYRGKSISQDLCNSVHEFNSIADSVEMSRIRNVVELGAGYGRTAYVILKTLPQVNYTIIDIPPALYIAQWYLSKVFSREKIFHYRRFELFSQVKKDFEAAKIRFLMSDQIELLPRQYFDLSINISSLHEMRREQIKNYLLQMDRICKGYLYMKQWQRSLTRDNLYIKQEQYPIPKKWKLIYSRYPHPVHKWFFDALYKIT